MSECSPEEIAAWHAHVRRLEQIMDERDKRYDAQFSANDEKTKQALVSSKEAVAKAEIATEKRFDSVNEFRATLSDQAANLMPRSEATMRFISIESRLNEFREEVRRDINTLRESRSEESGKSQTYYLVIGFIFNVVFVAVAVAALFVRK